MQFEIELKAWVDDYVSLENTLSKLARFEHSFYKKDEYFILPRGSDGAKTIRIREENEKVYVTMKKKTIRDGMEENEEIEFSVSDKSNFQEMLERLGFSKYIEKEKKGKKYSHAGFTIEISHVKHLGDFIEIEKIMKGKNPGEVQPVRLEIRKILAKLGVPEEKIEPRRYISMLQEGT
jgi:adenylate cyclase class 2